jgi:hypothetical protein
MAKPKLEIFQARTDKGETYLIHRYFDDSNNNYEYQIYKLVQAKKVAREFGIRDNKTGRKEKLTTREMCDKLIDKITSK